MKFPVLFRVFAVLNILAFFILGIMAVMMLTEPEEWGLFMIWIQWAVTIWLFVSAIAWFFAGKASYHFLYTLVSMLLVVCTYWAWFIWASEQLSHMSARQKIMTSVVPGVIFLYIVFLIVALFYGPVVSWTEKRFSVKHASIALGVFLLIGGGLYTFAAVNKKQVVIDHILYFPDSATDILIARSSIPGNQSIQIAFNYVESVGAIAINQKPDSVKDETIHFAKLAYVESGSVDPKKSPFIVIEFVRDGNQLLAEFPPVRASQIQLFPLSENKQSPSAKVSYFCAGIAPMRIFSVFDKRKDDAVLTEQQNPVPETEQASEPVADVSNGTKISKETVDGFYNIFITDTYFSEQSDYTFDFYTETPLLVNGSIRLGLFKRGLAYIKPDLNEAVKKFQGFSNYEYENYFKELTGFELYSSKARDYENENNGTSFNYLNPAVIEWAEENLVPKTGHEILGYTAQNFYDKVFRRMMRMAVLSRVHLMLNDYQEEVVEYAEAARVGGQEFYGPDYLNNRYRDVLLDEYCGDETYQNSAEFIGFWLRRRIDGTDQQCWDALYRVMEKYDGDWLTGAVGDLNAASEVGDEGGM